MEKMTVGGTRSYYLQSHSNSLQGHMNCLSSYLGIKLSSSCWNTTRYLQSGYLVTLQTNYDKLEFFSPSCALQWCCTNRYATMWANWRRSLYSYSTDQPPTVTQLCTVANSRKAFVATGCCKNVVAFWQKMLYRQVLTCVLILLMNIFP